MLLVYARAAHAHTQQLILTGLRAWSESAAKDLDDRVVAERRRHTTAALDRSRPVKHILPMNNLLPVLPSNRLQLAHERSVRLCLRGFDEAQPGVLLAQIRSNFGVPCPV